MSDTDSDEYDTGFITSAARNTSAALKVSKTRNTFSTISELLQLGCLNFSMCVGWLHVVIKVGRV